MMLIFLWLNIFHKNFMMHLLFAVLLIVPTGRYNIAQGETLSFKIKRGII